MQREDPSRRLFDWKTNRKLTGRQLEPIDRAVRDLRAFIEDILPGEGSSWIRRNLSFLSISVGGLPNRLISRLKKANTTIVFPQRSIWFADSYTHMKNPEHHIVHELAHALDNSLSNRLLPATLFGGGPADALVSALGGDPRGLRVNNPQSVPPAFRWSMEVNEGYGNSSTAEYFAETLCWSVYDTTKLPSPAVINALKKILFDLQAR